MRDFIKESSGNVYKDLGYADAGSMKIKAGIVGRISQLMKEKNISQERVAELTGMPPGRVAQILKGQFRGASEYALLACLASLGQDIEISCRQADGEKGKIVFAQY